MTEEQQALCDLMPVIMMLENAGMALFERQPVLFAKALGEAFTRYQELPPNSPVPALYRKWLVTHGPT